MKYSLMAVLCLNLAHATDYRSFETVQDLFESTMKPATLAEFETFGEESKKKCMMFGYHGHAFEVAPFQKRIHTTRVESPERGPLFPGWSRDYKRSVLVPADFLNMEGGYSNDMARQIEEVSSYIWLRERPSYLEMNVRYIPSGVSSKSWFSYANDPLQVRFRQGRDYLLVKIISDRYVAYGYCWNK